MAQHTHEHGTPPVLRSAPSPTGLPDLATAEVIPLPGVSGLGYRRDRLGTSSWIRPGRTLLVASSGGHIEELFRLRARMQPDLGEVEWATFRTDQTTPAARRRDRPLDPEGGPEGRSWLARGCEHGLAHPRPWLRPGDLDRRGGGGALPCPSPGEGDGRSLHRERRTDRRPEHVGLDGGQAAGRPALRAVPVLDLRSRAVPWVGVRLLRAGSSTCGRDCSTASWSPSAPRRASGSAGRSSACSGSCLRSAPSRPRSCGRPATPT